MDGATIDDSRVLAGAQSADHLRPGVAPKSAVPRPSRVSIRRVPHFVDLRGSLSVGEFSSAVPFVPKRYFLVHGVPVAQTRGEHAHRRCHQFLLCVHGSCKVRTFDGVVREDFLLDEPSLGLHIPPMTWASQYDYSPGAVLLVFASEAYDAEDYVRDYGDFLKMLAEEAMSANAGAPGL